jgi:predicted CopG family antitoxin
MMCIYNVYINRWDVVARQISVSNEVYEMLLKRKANKSFSQVIKENLCPEKEKVDIMSLAGILKDDKQTLERLKKQIATEREANYGRTFE